jgi:hypothetical protein
MESWLLGVRRGMFQINPKESVEFWKKELFL